MFKALDLLNVDPLLIDRVRLAIMAALNASKHPLEFMEILTALELSRGNLAGHVKKLEAGGFIEVHKEFVDRKPRTTYRCTPKGKKEFRRYLDNMEAMLQGMK
jgi:DNA-binding MarR family transcriptional regulator